MLDTLPPLLLTLGNMLCILHSGILFSRVLLRILLFVEGCLVQTNYMGGENSLTVNIKFLFWC